MKIMIDTNIALDVLLNRTPALQSSLAILKLAALDKITGIITTNAVTDMFYVLNKNSKDSVKSRSAVEQLLKLVKLEAVIPSDIFSAFSSDVDDFEDAVVSMVANRIKSDFIVTGNINDFTKSPVPAIKPCDFLSKYFPNTL